MKLIYEWGIPSAGFLIWIVLTFSIVPALVRSLRKRSDQTERLLDEILPSVLGTPLILFLLGLGLHIFMDTIPSIPTKLTKYSDALLIILFVLAGYLFLDRLMIEVLRRYSKKVDFIASSEGVMKTLYRSIILIFIFLIVLDRLKITITPFIASLGIGTAVVGFALQDTLSNFFSGIYINLDKPVRIGDYIRLESGEEGYVVHVGWRSTRIRMLSNNILILPNSKLAASRVINFYLPDSDLSILVNGSVSYQSDLEKVERVTMDVAKQVLQETDGADKGFEPFIRYNSFGDSGINFTVILRGKEYTNQYLIIHEFIKRLHRRYQSEGIEIPLPSRTVYMKNGTPKSDVS
jgi:small-conductance mechanosensitive channel